MGLTHHLNAVLEEAKDQQGKSAYAVLAMNGQELFATLTGGAGIRRMLTVEGVCYIVSGRVVFSLTAAAVQTQLGGIGSDGWVTMAANRKTPNPQIAIVCDGLWYLLEGGIIREGTDPDLPPPLMVLEVDGYLVFLIRDGRWFIVGPNDAGNVDPLDFAEAEANADQNVGGAVRGRTLIIFGAKSTEFHDPVVDVDFPFARTATSTFGCYAGPTVANAVVMRGQTAVDTVILCGTDHEGAYMGVVALDGYQPVVISTPEVDALVEAEDPADLSAFYYTEDGHLFYVLSGASFSYAYDGRYGEWAQRQSFGSDRWKPGYSAKLGNYTLLGRANENKIMRSDRALMDEAGDTILWRMQPPTVNTWPKGFKVPTVWVDALTGVGLVTGAATDTDPQLHIDFSKDGGLSWGAQRHAALGAAGQRFVRVKQHALGRFDHNGMTLRFSCSANAVRGIQQVAVAATPLRG
jgi:hypothetical protein